MNRQNSEYPNFEENKTLIDSLPKLARYLGLVALEIPGAMVKILRDVSPVSQPVKK